MQGLLGNPVVDGLLSGGGPMDVRNRARAAIDERTPPASGGRIAPPPAPAPDRSRAAAIESLGRSGAAAIQGYAEQQEKEEAEQAEIKMLTGFLDNFPDPDFRERVAPLLKTAGGRQMIMSLAGEAMKPKDRKILEGSDGVKRYVDTGEQVFPGVKPKAGALQQAYDRNAGRLVFATDEEIRSSGGRLAPAGEKPGAPKEPKLMPVFDKQAGVVTYATADEVKAERGRFGPVSAAPDGGKYRQRTRPIDDQTQVFEVSFDGGMTWEAQGNPVARSVDPTAALLTGLLGGGGLVDGEGGGAGGGGAPVTRPASSPAAAPVAGPAAARGGAAPEDIEATLNAARSAIQNGRDRASVIQQLRAVGIDPALLDQ